MWGMKKGHDVLMLYGLAEIHLEIMNGPCTVTGLNAHGYYTQTGL